MGIISKRKAKKYNYTPRYYQNDGEGSPYEIEHKFDKFRHTVGSSGIKSNAKNAWADLRKKPDKTANRRILIIAAIFILLFLFIIDFDLSIFLQQY
jgi:hypothetical protein